MKTNKLPQSVSTDARAAGSQFQQPHNHQSHKTRAHNSSQSEQTSLASNDANYGDKVSQDTTKSTPKDLSSQKARFGYKSTDSAINADNHIDESTDVTSAMIDDVEHATVNNATAISFENQIDKADQASASKVHSDKATSQNNSYQNHSYKEIPERVFMNGLIKHTGIALAIIIPLAAFSAYAATPSNPSMDKTMSEHMMKEGASSEVLSVQPSDIIYNSASEPTTVDNVDLNAYADTWYEIGRLPMYFQRKCAGNVTANYAQKADGTGITVTNSCAAEDGSSIVAEGLAKPVDESGSKLKVTFLPKWIRWIPVGRADYWILARDTDYKTALVGTPDKESLWLLARSPNISQETYTKYRQIAQQQGYDLKTFKITPQSQQTVSLTP